MSVKQARKIGFFSALAILIGSVIGIGIFLKNGSVFAANYQNGYGILISWIIAAVVSVCTAFSFAEVSSTEHSKAGLASWAGKLIGKKTGYFIKVNMPFFYFSILMVAIFIFTGEALFSIFDQNNKIPFYWVVIVSIFIFAGLVALNTFAFHASKQMQMVITIVKFLPIVLVIILGFAFFNQVENGNRFNVIISGGENGSTTVSPLGPINPAGILSSLPAILFAFDSFLGVGNLSKEMKKPEMVSKVIVFGMIFCSIIYILITIVQILVGEGIVSNVFKAIFQDNVKVQLAFEYIVKVSMFIAVFGVANSITMTSIRSFDYLIHERIVYKADVLYTLSGKKELIPGAILFSISCVPWFIINLIFAIVFKHDAFTDGMSNFPTLFFFAVYGIVILFAIINRFTKKVEITKVKGFMPIAIFACIGILVIFGYQFFYDFMYNAFSNPNGTLSWGVFYGPSDAALKVKNWEGSIVFFSFIILFIGIPFINYLLVKKEKKIQTIKLKKEIKKLCLNQ